MVLGLNMSGGIMSLLLSFFLNIVPWLITVIAIIVALYIYIKVRKAGMWSFVKTSPGDDLLFTKNTDGSGDLRKGQYYKQDSTIQDAGDDTDPFICPSAEAGINFAGRRIFQVFRGLGSVQSMEGMAAARILKELGVQDGSDFKDFMAESKYMIVPKAAVNKIEDKIETRDDGEERKVSKVEIEYMDQDENIATKTVSGLVVDLSEAPDISPYNVQSENMGSIRARAFNKAWKKVKKKNWAKWIGLAVSVLAICVVLLVIFFSVFRGGGAPSVGM